MWMQQRNILSELPVIDVHLGRERARSGDRDGAIPVLRKSVDDMVLGARSTYYIPAIGDLVETLLDRGADGDVAEAEAAIARLAAAPAEGSVILDVWLLRLRALLARAHGDDAGYRDLQDQYRALSTSLGLRTATSTGRRRCHDLRHRGRGDRSQPGRRARHSACARQPRMHGLRHRAHREGRRVFARGHDPRNRRVW